MKFKCGDRVVNQLGVVTYKDKVLMVFKDDTREIPTAIERKEFFETFKPLDENASIKSMECSFDECFDEKLDFLKDKQDINFDYANQFKLKTIEALEKKHKELLQKIFENIEKAASCGKFMVAVSGKNTEELIPVLVHKGFKVDTNINSLAIRWE